MILLKQKTIHNQETIGENELFEKGTGKFANFFAELGIAQSDAHNSGENSLSYHLPKLSKKVNTLLVHNTFSSKADVDFALTFERVCISFRYFYPLSNGAEVGK